jgi:carboxylate-amine ligase
VNSRGALTDNLFIGLDAQMKWKTEGLAQIFDQAIVEAQDTVLDNEEYLTLFGLQAKSALASELWRHIFDQLIKNGNMPLKKIEKDLQIIFENGTLAQRIIRSIGNDRSKENIVQVYRRLSDCLSRNEMFLN